MHIRSAYTNAMVSSGDVLNVFSFLFGTSQLVSTVDEIRAVPIASVTSDFVTATQRTSYRGRPLEIVNFKIGFGVRYFLLL